MKLIVKYHEDGAVGHVNIPADRMEISDGILYAYCADRLAGVFDLGSIDMAYLSGGAV